MLAQCIFCHVVLFISHLSKACYIVGFFILNVYKLWSWNHVSTTRSCKSKWPCCKNPQHCGPCNLKPRGSWHIAEAGSWSASCDSHMPKIPKKKRHSLLLQGSVGRNNSRQASLDSLVLPALWRMCLRKTCIAARVPLASVRYLPLQDLIKRDVHGFCHDRWEPSFQKHLCLQSETEKKAAWLKQESMQPCLEMSCTCKQKAQ